VNIALISDPLTEKLIARMFSWKSNVDESDGLTTHFPRLPRDGHQLATANLVGQKPPDACHENRDKCRWIVAALCPKENEEDVNAELNVTHRTVL